MQTERMPQSDGEKRVWLSESEVEGLLEVYSEEPRKKIALSLMVRCGLRSDEVTRVSKSDIRETEQGDYKLKIQKSKTGERECPISESIVKDLRTVHNVRNLNKGESVVDVTTRTIQRWVTSAAEDLAEDGWVEKDWKHVSAHDLRRTWATRLYWSLEGDRAREVVMSFGGWKDVQTFKDNYLGTIPDRVTHDILNSTEMY